MPNATTVITQAFRRIGVGGVGDPLSAEEVAEGRLHLDALFAELEAGHGFDFGYALAESDVPPEQIMPLAWLLAVDIAPSFDRPLPESRERAIFRLRAVTHPYERDMDLNGDGETTTDEIAAFDRGAFY